MSFAALLAADNEMRWISQALVVAVVLLGPLWERIRQARRAAVERERQRDGGEGSGPKPEVVSGRASRPEPAASVEEVEEYVSSTSGIPRGASDGVSGGAGAAGAGVDERSDVPSGREIWEALLRGGVPQAAPKEESKSKPVPKPAAPARSRGGLGPIKREAFEALRSDKRSQKTPSGRHDGSSVFGPTGVDTEALDRAAPPSLASVAQHSGIMGADELGASVTAHAREALGTLEQHIPSSLAPASADLTPQMRPPGKLPAALLEGPLWRRAFVLSEVWGTPVSAREPGGPPAPPGLR